MLDLDVTGYRRLSLSHLVLDFNGTMACDGVVCDGVKQRLEQLARLLTLHVVTGDAHHTAGNELQGSPCNVVLLQPENQAEAKYRIVEQLGAEATAVVGNGRNDVQMMRAATLAIAVIGPEGASGEAVVAAHVVTSDIRAALDLLLHRSRLLATLRS